MLKPVLMYKLHIYMTSQIQLFNFAKYFWELGWKTLLKNKILFTTAAQYS